MKFSMIIKGLLFCWLITFFLLLGSPGSGLTSEIELKIGGAFDVTGPYAESAMILAYDDYLKWVSDKGGVKDLKGQMCKFKLIWQDCASDIPRGLVAYKDFKAQGCLVHYYCATGQNAALKAQAAKDQTPLVSQLVSNVIFEGEDSWVYGHTGGRENITTLMDGVKKIWKKNTPPTIGFLTWDNLFGTDMIPFGKAYAKRLGFVVGPDEYFSPKALDVTPQIRRLYDAKCNFVVLALVGGQASVIFKNKSDLGYKDMLFIGTTPLSSGSWSTLKKMDPKIYNGNMIYSTFAVETDDSPGTKLMREAHKKYHGEGKWDDFAEYACAFPGVYVTVAAIEKALQKVPGDKITGGDVKKYGLDTLKIDGFGLAMGFSYVDYPGDRQSTAGGRLFEMRDGKLIPLTGWLPNSYQAPHSPTAPDWVKETAKALAEKTLKK